MATIHVMEAANVFAGDGDPSATNHLGLMEIKLPTMEENYANYTPGGGVSEIEINTHINRLELTFNLIGFNEKVKRLFGSWAQQNQRFTAYGGIRDRLTGKLYKATAKVWGRLGRAAPTNFQRGNNFAHEYAVRGITHYELIFAGRRIYYLDIATNSFIVGDTDMMAEMNAILGIPTSDAPVGGVDISGAVVLPQGASA